MSNGFYKMRQKTFSKSYYKVRQKFITKCMTKCDRLLQSITKCDSYCKVRRNTTTCKDGLANSLYAK